MPRAMRSTTLVLLVLTLLLTACIRSAPVQPAAVPVTLTPAMTPAPTNTPRPTRTPAPTSTPRPTNTPTATHTPTPISGAACLIGTWQVEDMSSYLASLTGGTNTQAQVLSESGPITYQFDGQGRARVTVNQLLTKMRVPVGGIPLNLNVTISGTATAIYTTLDPDTLTFSDAQLGGLTVSAKLGSRQLFGGTATQVADQFGFSLAPLFSAAAYDCRVDTLKYTPPLQGAQEVLMQRIQ